MHRTQTDWRLIGLLYIGGLLAAWQFAKIALSLVDLAAVYQGYSAPLLVSGVSVAGIVFGATAGVLIARIGARLALLAALLAAAGLTAAQALLPPYPVIMILRVLEGFAHLSIVVAAPTLMAAVAVGKDVPVAMGLWGTFFGVGFALAAFVFPYLGSTSGILWANAVALVGLAAGLAWTLPTSNRSGGDGQSFIARHIAIYSNPSLVAPAIGFFAHTLVFLGLLTFLPDRLGAWTATLLPLIALVGTFGAGFLARRIAPKSIMIFAFALSVVGMASAAFIPDPMRIWIVLPLMAVIGLVPGAAFANVPYLNADSQRQALANGAIAQLGNVGTAASVPMFAAALQFGFIGMSAVFVVISTLGLVAVWVIHKKIALQQ